MPGTAGHSAAPEFLMAFTDSSKGCTKQWSFTSSHVHVSSELFS